MLRRLALACLVSSPALAATQEVRLSSGWVRGIEHDQTMSYRGIPYAQPPRGALRWQPPVTPAEGWDGVRDASKYGTRCPQASTFGKPTESFDFGSEDCLFLNVWVPQKEAFGPRPVMVYLHGGGFDGGSGEGMTLNDHLYSGEKLAAHGDVIVVTFNYRLGALGFLAEPALRATSGQSGNFGLMDQVAALQWVQREIAAFGGDAQDVTVFGESSGAMSICALVAQSTYTGLFQRAIMQSGSCQARALQPAEETGTAYAAQLGCKQESLDERAACLRGQSVAAIIKKQPNFSLAPFGSNPGLRLPWSPTVDGQLLRDFPLAIVQRGEHQRVPMIIGTNDEELPPAIYYLVGSQEGYRKLLRRAGYAEDELAKVMAVYSKERFGSYAFALSALGTDIQFNCSSRALARAAASHAPASVFSYSFAKPASKLSRHFIGTFHGVDLLYVFQKLSLKDIFGFVEDKNRKLAATVGDYWTSFARMSRPSSLIGPEWQAFVGDDAQQLRLDHDMEMIPAQRDAECRSLASFSVGLDR